MATSASWHGNFSDKDQPTLGTVADLFADARVLLQDEIPPYRYKDSSLLTALNVTMLDTRRLRPDLFVFDLAHRGQVQAFTAVDDTYVNIEPQFRLGILYWLCGHALARDQEDVQDVRATTFFGLGNAIMIGHARGGIGGGSGPERGPQQQGAGG
jgi:hypothetical protein